MTDRDTIRAKTTADAPALADLMAATHAHDGYPRFLPTDPVAFMYPAGELAGWVAVRGGIVVGHVALHDADDPALRPTFERHRLAPDETALVGRLMVLPARRGTGLGRRLLDTAVDRVGQLGRRAALDVDQAAAGPIALYEALGWTRIGDVTLTVHDDRRLDLWVYLSPDPTIRSDS